MIFTFRSNRARIAAAALHANHSRRVLLHIIVVARVQSKCALLRRAGKTNIILTLYGATVYANRPENRPASRQLGKNNNKRPFSRTTHSPAAAVSIKPLLGFPPYNPAVKFGARACVLNNAYNTHAYREPRAKSLKKKKKKHPGRIKTGRLIPNVVFCEFLHAPRSGNAETFNGKSEVDVFGGEERKKHRVASPCLRKPIGGERDKDVWTNNTESDFQC